VASYGPALKRIFGASAAAVEANLVPVTLTWPKGDGHSKQSKTVKVNKHVMAARLRNVNAAMVVYCKAHGVGYTLDDVECFNWRSIVGSSSQSMHSGAIAIDINPGANPMTYGKVVTNMHPWMISIFETNGFTWGGSWSGRKDAMHYELRVFTEPTVAKPAPTACWVSARTKRTGNLGLVDKLATSLGDETKQAPRSDGSVAWVTYCGPKAATRIRLFALTKGIWCKVTPTATAGTAANMTAVLATE
jgi:hypothetical protein